MRKLLRLVDVHRSAEHDETVVTADIGLLIGLPRKIDVANAKSGAAEHRVEYAQRFAGGMLKDEELAHAEAQIVPLCRYKRYAMRTSWRIMQWRGVPIFLNWTVLIGLPWFYYRLGNLVDMAAAFVALLSLLLIHEMGHAAVAKWRQVPVLEIRLFLLHGHCMHEVPEQKSDGVWIAWGGVAAQFALLVIAFAVSKLLEAMAFELYLHAQPVLGVFIATNIFIMLFNLTPLPGLDGTKAWLAVPMLWKYWRRDRRLKTESKMIAADVVEWLKKKR